MTIRKNNNNKIEEAISLYKRQVYLLMLLCIQFFVKWKWCKSSNRLVKSIPIMMS